MPGVPGFRCFFRAVRRVHHREPVSEGRARDHYDNVGFCFVLMAIEWLDVDRWWSLQLKRGKGASKTQSRSTERFVSKKTPEADRPIIDDLTGTFR